MLKQIALVACIVMIITAPAFASVTDSVKKTVDDVVRIVSNKKIKNERIRRQELKRAIDVIFDYQEMAKRSLGRHWNEQDPTERNKFVELFAILLENSYANKIESYNNEKIAFINETVDGSYAEVRSRIVSPSNEEFSLDYRLLNKNGTWVVYDIVIEGVSLVSNYRGQFNRYITEHGYAELVKKLEKTAKSDAIQ